MATHPAYADVGGTVAGGALAPAQRTGNTRAKTERLDLLRKLIFLYILFGVGRIHEHFAFLSHLRPVLLSFVLICGYILLSPQSVNLMNVFRTKPGKALVGLAVIACLSVPFGISLGGAAVFIIEEYASVLIFTTLMIAAMTTTNQLRMLMFAFVASGAFWVYLSLFVIGSSVQGISGILRLDVDYTYDANDICVIFATALPLGFLAWMSGKRLWKILGAVVIVGAPASVALSGSRGGLLGLVAAMGMLFLVVRQISMPKKLGAVFVAVIAMIAAAPEGYWDQMETILRPTEDYNWFDPLGRKAVMERGVGYILQYPVFGLGVNQFPRAEGTIGPMARFHVAGTGLRFMAPHNTPLQIATEMGLVGLIVWLSVVWMGTVGLLRLRKGLSRHPSAHPEEQFLYHTCTFLPAAWAGFFVASVFVSFAYLVPYYILLAYTAATYMLVLRRGWETAGEERPVNTQVGPVPEWRSRRPVPVNAGWRPDRSLPRPSRNRA